GQRLSSLLSISCLCLLCVLCDSVVRFSAERAPCTAPNNASGWTLRRPPVALPHASGSPLVKDLSQLLTALPFPTALDRVRRSFARQPDCQTCGASAIRHGLLLGGLTIPTAALEAVLSIRENQGT